MDEFYSIIEKVALVLIKLSRRCRLQVVPDYAATLSYHNKAFDNFLEDAEWAMNKVVAQFPVTIGESNAKGAREQVD